VLVVVVVVVVAVELEFERAWTILSSARSSFQFSSRLFPCDSTAKSLDTRAKQMSYGQRTHTFMSTFERWPSYFHIEWIRCLIIVRFL
jgi:hypothetical protein